ncbi:FIG00003370: Multicopper polyphenol oxidase [hydrothermal vent metagenome]|uniref:FIG00003370: Multicopper polyphenol oxidase n=1 Tax=hydrothermal vent metagenome TaxID=652676 RepID=A0A3B0YDI1_9ZZZZ
MNVIKATWKVPEHVHVVCTTRGGGVSSAPYDSLNLGEHVADDETAVKKNRELLCESLKLKSSPLWLTQIHSTKVIEFDQALVNKTVKADGSFTTQQQQVCSVMTADCLPVAIYNHTLDSIAVVHAGWKGLAAGIIAQGVNCLKAGKLSVWLGPAIGPHCFEVGDEVKIAFVEKLAVHSSAFVPISSGKWLANMYLLARQQLQGLGITQIFGGDYCTFSQPEQFYSYRRDQITGRMATLAWLSAP